MTNFTAEAFCYLGIGVCVVMLRIYVRACRQRAERPRLAADDILMICALVPYTTAIVLAFLVGERYGGIANGGMTDAYRAALPRDSKEFVQRVNGAKIQIAGWSVYVTTLWLVKASLCAFYTRLTDRLAEYRTRIRVGYAAIALTYVATMLVILFSCQPMHRFWQINPNPGNHCQPALSKVYVFTVMILNILTDLYLIAIPLPLLWGARLPLIKKLSLTVVFSGAFFVMAAGILRGVLIVEHSQTPGGPRRGSAWAIRETFVAIFTSNLPPMWGWLSSKFAPCIEPLISSLRSGEKPQESPELRSITTGNGSGSASANPNEAHHPRPHHHGAWRGDVSSHIRSSNRLSEGGAEAADTFSDAKKGTNSTEDGTQRSATTDGMIRKRVVIEMESMPVHKLAEMPAPTDLFDKPESPQT